jgi:hypothetical protein
MLLTTLACLAFMYYREFENLLTGPPEDRGLLIIGGILSTRS